MTGQEIINIKETYLKLLEQQQFIPENLDYAVLEQHIPKIQKLADIGNSAVGIFDAYKKEHAFYSHNLGLMLGYCAQEVKSVGEYFFDTKIHPEDFMMLKQNALSVFKLYFNLSIDEKLNHKFISEYRILDAANNYIRVIEQHQILELDNNGNVWLILSILDISPNQRNMNEGVKSELLNFRTGKIIPFIEPQEKIAVTLTKKEIEVLELVKDGYLSKEISTKLHISLHTVNTHRQKVLGKLGVNNSMEAVMLATKLGLI